MSAGDVFLGVLIVLACAGVAAAVMLPIVVVVYRRGSAQIDAALAACLDMRDEEQARGNVRVLRSYDVARRVERARRRGSAS